MGAIVDYDIIILGAGPAGLTAGIYALRRGLKTLVLEKAAPGGRVMEAPLVENYPGFPEPITGAELAQRILTQFEKFGGKAKFPEEVISLELKEDVKKVVTRKASYTAKTVILAIGVQRRKLLIPGEAEFLGRGVSYCAVCDGPFFKGKIVAVVGSEDEAFQDALFLSDMASKVVLVPNSARIMASALLIDRFKENANAEIMEKTTAYAIEGDQLVRTLKVKNLIDGVVKSVQVDGVFIAVGYVPMTEIIKKAGVEVDERGCIKVDRKQKTNLEGVFAAGDCTCGGMQIITAAGEGAKAIISASLTIRK